MIRSHRPSAAAVVSLLAGAVLCGGATAVDGRPYAAAWQRSYVNPKRPDVIKVAYRTEPATALDHASVYLHDDRVTITIWLTASGQVPASGVVRCAAVRMGEPLRGRRRFDGKTHRHPKQPAEDPLVRELKLKRAACPKPKVVRHQVG